MCGIFALINESSSAIDLQALERIFHLIDLRGPDFQSKAYEFSAKCGLHITFKASVLHLRGKTIQEQPTIDADNNILLFNGQIYKFEGKPIADSQIADTTFLSEKLRLCHDKRSIVDVFALIDGPFAFIYWNDSLNALFYGRDIFGRKSLCELNNSDQDSKHPIIISSVSLQNNKLPSIDAEWLEVDCKKFTCIDFSRKNEPETEQYFWNIDEIYPRTAKCAIPPMRNHESNFQSLNFNPMSILNGDARLPSEFDEFEHNAAIFELEQRLLKSVETRFKYNRETCLVCRHNQTEQNDSGLIECTHSKVAVAFSGGLDSTLLAMALDKLLDINETIDLITVAFKDKSPDRNSVAQAFLELRKLCPKRKWLLVLCDISMEELQQERTRQIADIIWPCNTVLDDSLGCACWFIGRAKGRALSSEIEDKELANDFETFIRYNPSGPWSTASESHIISQYKSAASMIFVGSSIDEQLGGYGSHRVAWKESGIKGIFEEVSFLMRRLSSRNLGRDDRVYSHHGRDVKLPYLDFEFVSYLNQLPLGLKMNLSDSNEIGPKKILRQLAITRWGLEETGRRVKRALQFGTRIANLENPGEKGDQICPRLMQTNN